MTLEDAQHITKLCTNHELARPTIHNEAGRFSLDWKLPDGSITLTSYDAAFHFMRCMFIERESKAVQTVGEKGRPAASQGF